VGLNPFDWTGGPFLTLYVALAVIVLLTSLRARTTIGPSARSTQELNVLELAYLGGGPRRVGDAVLLALTAANGATVDSTGRKITVTDQRPIAGLMNRPPQLTVYRDMTRQQFQAAVKPLVERTQERLGQLGYYPSDEQTSSYRKAVLPFIAALMAFGTFKAFIGAERNHPVGFLILLLFVTAVAGLLLARRPLRTRAGKEALQEYQASNARASRAPRDNELLLALALSGAVVLSGTAYAPIYAASRTMTGSDGGGGCGGGGGGDGGGGCGGCS